jgi:hypothetical protein
MSCCMPYDCVDELVMDGPHRLHRIFMEQWSVQHDAVDSVPILMERHVAPRALAALLQRPQRTSEQHPIRAGMRG